MRIAQEVLSIALVASGLLGIQILLNDKWLWSAAPSHAFGLVGFVAIDALLTLAVWNSRFRLATLGATLVSSLQLGAMLTDLVSGQPMGVPTIAFRNYLLSDSPYVALLLVQPMILVVAIGALAFPLLHKRVRLKTLVFPRHH